MDHDAIRADLQNVKNLHMNDEKSHRSPSSASCKTDIQEGTIADIDETPTRTAVAHVSHQNETIPDSDLSSSWHHGDDAAISSQPRDYDSEKSPQGERGLGLDTEHWETAFRKRGTSISFHPEATLDNGARHALEHPLPKTDGQPSELGNMDGTSNNFDSERIKINPFTGQPIKRRPRKSDVTPKLETVDSFDNRSQDTAQEDFPPREVDTPMSDASSFIMSPGVFFTPAVSPFIDSEPWPAMRQGSIRSNRPIASRPQSIRRESRRNSKRSVSSSQHSPASAFLSRYGRDSMNNMATEADDEGQSFGLDNEYIIGRQVGYGGFSVVKEAHFMSDQGERFRRAVKIVRKTIADKDEPENEKYQQELEHEVDIWRCLGHKNILALHAVFDTSFATFCVMDLIDGGSLYDLVSSTRKTGIKGLTATSAQTYAFQLACALRYLHEDVRIVHRDVKLENCLIDRGKCTSADDLGILKLCDFGLADFISGSPVLRPIDGNENGDRNASSGDRAGILGSLAYAAPEVVESHSPLLVPCLDVWAYGVCVYTMAVGDLPFKHSLPAKLVDMISNGSWSEEAVRNSAAADGVEDAQGDIMIEMLEHCLDKDTGLRWNIGDVLGSAWFEHCGDPYEG